MAEESPQATADPPKPKRGREFIRHPVVVGTALALISGLIASVLFPALTRSWQDRPRELALKQDLVSDVSQAATGALSRGNIFAYRTELEKTSKAERIRNLTRESSDWDVASSAIGSQLATYFGDTTLPKQWAAYQTAVSGYIELTSQANKETHPEWSLIDHFQSVRFEDKEWERERKETLSDTGVNPMARPDPSDGALVPPNAKAFNRIAGLRLLGFERDQIARRILAADAAGFSHGFWIFGASRD
jgi:hypothetical protein